MKSIFKKCKERIAMAEKYLMLVDSLVDAANDLGYEDPKQRMIYACAALKNLGRAIKVYYL